MSDRLLGMVDSSLGPFVAQLEEIRALPETSDRTLA